MTTFRAVELIRLKRDGHALTNEQIMWLVNAYTAGEVTDEQMSAMAMAIFFQELNDDELAHWTTAMINTGERLDFGSLSRPTADKHSTGGVGDKITLPLAPIVAACGVAVPQLSGRGLGHTGGTLDKLEAIPGWRALLSNAEMMRQLDEVGAVICGAGSGLAPADRKLYALRDVTATVESTALISSSIMSKKIAEGTQTLVLDVKTGSGAFMSDLDRATLLATRMVALGKNAGVHTVAFVTNMDTPLGYAVGNALEVAESLDILAGGGPDDVLALTLALAQEMIAGAGIEADPRDAISSGRAMDVWNKMIEAQDGDPHAPLPTAREQHTIVAPSSGYVTRLDAMPVAIAAWRLGAGRAKLGDPVSAGAGVLLHAKEGDLVQAGAPLMTLYTDDESLMPAGLAALEGGYVISDQMASTRPLIIDKIS